MKTIRLIAYLLIQALLNLSLQRSTNSSRLNSVNLRTLFSKGNLADFVLVRTSATNSTYMSFLSIYQYIIFLK